MSYTERTVSGINRVLDPAIYVEQKEAQIRDAVQSHSGIFAVEIVGHIVFGHLVEPWEIEEIPAEALLPNNILILAIRVFQHPDVSKPHPKVILAKVLIGQRLVHLPGTTFA